MSALPKKVTNVQNIAFQPHVHRDTLVEIITLEELQARKESLDHDPESPHRVDFNLLVMVEEGEGAHFLDFVYKPFDDRSLIFIRKNQIHAFDLSSKPKGKIVLFTDHFLEQIQSTMKIPFFGPTYLYKDSQSVISLSTSLKQSFSNLLLEIDKKVKHGEYNSPIVMHLFTSLFLLIERENSRLNLPMLEKNISK